jgi:hypothetical protein
MLSLVQARQLMLARADEVIEQRAMSVHGTKRTLGDVRYLVANGGKADMAIVQSDFRV